MATIGLKNLEVIFYGYFTTKKSFETIKPALSNSNGFLKKKNRDSKTNRNKNCKVTWENAHYCTLWSIKFSKLSTWVSCNNLTFVYRVSVQRLKLKIWNKYQNLHIFFVWSFQHYRRYLCSSGSKSSPNLHYFDHKNQGF